MNLYVQLCSTETNTVQPLNAEDTFRASRVNSLVSL